VIAKLPQAVRYPAVVAKRDCVYVFGGLVSGGEYTGRFSDLIQRVCVQHRTATIVGRLPMAVAHAMGALVAGRVLVLGGSTSHGPSAAILRFEPASERVVPAGRLPHPLTDAAVVTVHDAAYLLGGLSTRPLAGVIEVRLAQAGSNPPRARPCPARAVVGGRTHVASGAVALATGYGSLWLSGFDEVSRLEPAGGRVVVRIRTPGTGDYSQLAVGDGSVWVTSTPRGLVYRIDPSTNRLIATVHVEGPVQGIAVGMGRVWVTMPRQGRGQLIAIDPRDDRVTGPPIDVGPGPGRVVYGLHQVWVQNTSPSSVIRVDPASGRVTTVIATTPAAPGSPGPGAIAVGYGSLWSAANGSLTQVDPVTDRVLWSVPVPRAASVALGDDRVWVLAYPQSSSMTLFDPIKGTAALWELDPASGRVTGRPTRLYATEPIAIAAGPRNVWIADYDSATTTRMRLLTLHARGRRACRGSGQGGRQHG
jgi:streptogramin lyase